ncbi:MAG: hypothetical protein KGI37_08585 [Alphaproteobacteria bacterium]|nr:hypothetical protein [Alphaproteobacteria bacterium]
MAKFFYDRLMRGLAPLSLLALAAVLGAAPAYAASAGGFNSTTDDVTFSANGNAIMSLHDGKTPGTSFGVTFSGPITEGSTTLKTDGSMVVGNSAQFVSGLTIGNTGPLKDKDAATVMSLTSAPSCQSSQMMTKNSDGSFSCIGLQVTEGISATASGVGGAHSQRVSTSRPHAFCMLGAVQHDGHDSNCEIGGFPGGIWTLEADNGIAGTTSGTTNCAATCFDFQ